MTIPAQERDARGDASPKLMLVALSLIWGLMWPVARIALTGFPPLTMRLLTVVVCSLVIAAIAMARGGGIAIPAGRARLHVAIAGVLNMAVFGVFSALAQVNAATSRVAILVYTMPIWSSLLSAVILRERIGRTNAVALALCVAGMAVLIRPLLDAGVPLGILFALLAAFSWAAGSVYMKWAPVDAGPMALTFWQFLCGLAATSVALAAVDGAPQVADATPLAWIAVILTGAVGGGLAFVLWFAIIRRVSATTASLGILSVPIVGVVGSVIILGERPTATDLLGFVLIFAASACVLLAPRNGASARRAA